MNTKKLTREEFEAGTPFYFKGGRTAYLYATLNMRGETVGIVERNGALLCNVDRITGKRFHFYAYIFNARVSGYVKFDDLYTVIKQIN
jgi:hypothetical protein